MKMGHQMSRPGIHQMTESDLDFILLLYLYGLLFTAGLALVCSVMWLIKKWR